MRHWRRSTDDDSRHTVRRRRALAALAAALALAVLGTAPAAFGAATITVEPHDLGSGAALKDYTYLVNVDNAHLGDALSVDDRPMRAPTETYSPIAAEGDQDRPTVDLPSDCTGKANAARDGHGCRYLISVRSADHKMWGRHITLPDDQGTIRVDLSEASGAHPLPTGRIKVYVFNDGAWTNGAPDAEEQSPGLNMGGFHVTLEEQTNSQVSVDYHNRPLCSAGSGSITGNPGDCTTQDDGFMQIGDLSPATYFIYVTPPAGPCNSDPDSRWRQTTTIDGGFPLQAGVEQGSDGTGAPGELLFEAPNRRTAYWFGFACTPSAVADAYSGNGTISGQAFNWQGWPPFDTLIYDQQHPVAHPFVALTDQGTDTTVWQGRGDSDGNFNVPGVRDGEYMLSIWDEQLTYIMRFIPVTVRNGQAVDLGNIGVSRWFGWLDGTTYLDKNGNGRFDQGTDQPLPNTDMDQRWNDGSIKEETFTDATGHYEYPTAEGGALGKWFINEQGFARFSAFPGPSVHDELDPSKVLPACSAANGPATPCLGTQLGGGLLSNQLISEGHQATVDWGKQTYPAGHPGQIVGVTYNATTRNEFNPRLSAHEKYEPGIPNVMVRLESAAELGPDRVAGTADDPPWDKKFLLNEYVTDKWQKPGHRTDGQTCGPTRDRAGNDITADFNPAIVLDCLEVPINGQQTKDGAFDGGYAFADQCLHGYDQSAAGTDTPCFDQSGTGHEAPTALIAGDYVTHAVMPSDGNDSRTCNPTTSTIGQQVSDVIGTTGAHDTSLTGQKGCLYRIEREEDVNVDLGSTFVPAIPPPPCAGDKHVVDQATLTSRSTFYTGHMNTSPSRPLCDMRLVQLNNQQNANADFFLQPNFPDTVQHPDIAPDHPDAVGGVAQPGRVFGGVFDDIYFDRDPQSVWYGEPRPIGNVPVGIYGVDAPGNGPENWRLITTVTTDHEGAYEALLPSTETFNCPIPQGPCPGEYVFVVNDPGSKAHPNPNFNPNYLTASTTFDVWPGTTDVALDTPLDPISGTACSQSTVDSAGNITSTKPELLQAQKLSDSAGILGPFVRAGDGGAARRIAIDADFIGPAGTAGANGGHVVLTDQRTGGVTTLTRANGGIVSWTPGSATVADRIVIQVPAVGGGFPAGPKQLDIVTSRTNTGGALTTSNGITLHVLGGGGANAYNPPVSQAGKPATNGGHELQDAMDAAPDNGLVLLNEGVYHENVVQWKPLKLQGLGPGGLIGAHELLQKEPDDPRQNIQGSLIDGRYLRENAPARDAVIDAHRPPGDYAGVSATNPVIKGAGITVLARGTGAYGSGLAAARIDGVGIQMGTGDGAGGIEAQAYADNLRITNDVLDGNSGTFTGGIALGQPYLRDASGAVDVGAGSHNHNVQIHNNRLFGNGGIARAGGVGIFAGSNNYDLAENYICGNFGVEYGAGVSHWGNSPSGAIHDNSIIYNDAVDSGAGIAINDQTTAPDQPLGAGSGTVDVDRNLLQGNYSGDDGGAMFVQNSLGSRVNVRNNMIVDNGAADLAGGIALDDASNVAIVNNTVADNVSTGSSTQSLPINQGGVPHAAGLASEANDPRFHPTPARAFSDPVALFNNIFSNNQAFLLDHAGPGAALVSQGFIDLEVHGTGSPSDVLTPRYSLLTNGNILRGDGSTGQVAGGQGNQVGANPAFVDPFTLELAVAGSRLDPQGASVTISGVDPAIGIPGDYHLAAGSAAVDRGVRCARTPFPPPFNALAGCNATPPAGGRGVEAPLGVPSDANPGGGDFDRGFRPVPRSLRFRTPWDLGADER